MNILIFASIINILPVVAHILLKNKLGFFDLDKEGNLASLWTVILAWSTGTCAILICLLYKKLKNNALFF